MFLAKRVTTKSGPKSTLGQLMKIHNSASNEEQISKNINIRVFHRQVQKQIWLVKLNSFKQGATGDANVNDND